MKWYEYTIRDAAEELSQGGMWAENEDEVCTKLKRQGGLVLRIREGRQEMQRAGRKWRTAEVVSFSFQMSLLLGAGISIRRITGILAERKHKRIPFAKINESLQRGESLAEVLRQSGFPLIGTVLLQAGEAAGLLGESFRLIHSYFEKEQKWRSDLVAALAYPAFLLIIMTAFFFGAVFFILPSFQEVFASLGTELPWITKLLFQLGTLARAHLYEGSLLLAMLVGLLSWAVRRRGGVKLLHRCLWRSLSGYTWFHCFYYARITRVWAILLDSGLPLTETLRLGRELWMNDFAKAGNDILLEEIRQGQSFQRALAVSGLGTPVLEELVTAGEESGELVNMLRHCSEYYERQMAYYMGRLQQMIEPLTLSLMGAGVAVLVLAVMMPLFDSISAVSKL